MKKKELEAKIAQLEKRVASLERPYSPFTFTQIPPPRAGTLGGITGSHPWNRYAS